MNRMFRFLIILYALFSIAPLCFSQTSPSSLTENEKSEKVKRHIEEGNEFYNNKNWGKALEHYEYIVPFLSGDIKLEIQNKVINCYNKSGDDYYKHNDWEQALANYEYVLPFLPDGIKSDIQKRIIYCRNKIAEEEPQRIERQKEFELERIRLQKQLEAERATEEKRLKQQQLLEMINEKREQQRIRELEQAATDKDSNRNRNRHVNPSKEASVASGGFMPYTVLPLVIAVFFFIVIGFAIGSFFALPLIWYHAGHISRKLSNIITLLEGEQPKGESQEELRQKQIREEKLRLEDEYIRRVTTLRPSVIFALLMVLFGALAVICILLALRFPIDSINKPIYGISSIVFFSISFVSYKQMRKRLP